MVKKISFSLSQDSIDKAIEDIKKYKNDFTKKAIKLRDRVAEEIRSNSQTAFSSAIVDDLLNGAKKADVSVTVDYGGANSATLVIASGKDAIFVEFGAGVYHNGAVGSSPHPKGAELGLTIGSYGENGKLDTWVFVDDSGKHFTHGTPAAMPLYYACLTVSQHFQSIVREVFGG